MELSQEEIQNNIEYQEYQQMQYEIQDYIHENNDADTSSCIDYNDEEEYSEENELEYNAEFYYDIEDDVAALEMQNYQDYLNNQVEIDDNQQ